MANERLRASIASAHLTLDQVASQVEVDRKTVERWISGRIPHRSKRWALATLLAQDEAYLWPNSQDETRAKMVSAAELITLYPHRGAVPRDLWHALIEGANECIDLLAFAALFLPDSFPDMGTVLAEQAARGIRVRLALGDPASDAVQLRGREEGIGDKLAARIEMSLGYLANAIHAPGVEVRLHATTLYNSIYRFDEDVLVNTHAYGAPAAQSPVMHYRRLSGGRLFDHYAASFERVWVEAKPMTVPKP